MYRGGSWNYGPNAGVFSLGGNSRSNSNPNLGVRSAFIPEIG